MHLHQWILGAPCSRTVPPMFAHCSRFRCPTHWDQPKFSSDLKLIDQLEETHFLTTWGGFVYISPSILRPQLWLYTRVMMMGCRDSLHGWYIPVTGNHHGKKTQLPWLCSRYTTWGCSSIRWLYITHHSYRGPISQPVGLSFPYTHESHPWPAPRSNEGISPAIDSYSNLPKDAEKCFQDVKHMTRPLAFPDFQIARIWRVPAPRCPARAWKKRTLSLGATFFGEAAFYKRGFI